jgi:hypothetical protein
MCIRLCIVESVEKLSTSSVYKSSSYILAIKIFMDISVYCGQCGKVIHQNCGKVFLL